MTTSLDRAEILTEVRIPVLPDATGYAFEEFARRRGDYALAGVCTLLTVEEGMCRAARIAACGIGARPVRLAAAEDALAGRAFDEAARAEAGEAAKEYVTAQADLQASEAYRRDLLAALVRRTAATAAARAGS